MQTEWSPRRNDEHRIDDAAPAPDRPAHAGGWEVAEPVTEADVPGGVAVGSAQGSPYGAAMGDTPGVGDESGAATDVATTSVDGLEGEEEAHRSAVDAVDELLDEVELALARLDDGTYGRCETCGSPIDDAELAVLPLVRSCRPCTSGVLALEDA